MGTSRRGVGHAHAFVVVLDMLDLQGSEGFVEIMIVQSLTTR